MTTYGEIYAKSINHWLALGYTKQQAHAAAQHKIDCLKKLEGK